MRFSPLFSSTRITATPVEVVEMVRTPVVSTQESFKDENNVGPNSSSPTAPTILTVISEAGCWELEEGFGRERRAQATAWLAPFPPGPVENEVAVRVSPPDGTRGVMVTRSVFREPMTEIVFCAIVGVGCETQHFEDKPS